VDHDGEIGCGMVITILGNNQHLILKPGHNLLARVLLIGEQLEVKIAKLIQHTAGVVNNTGRAGIHRQQRRLLTADPL
jgi:hypothetical protein